MFDNAEFQQLIEKGYPTGEVVSSHRFMVTVKGLESVCVNAQVMFQSGQLGVVREVTPDGAVILNLTSESLEVGELAVLRSMSLTASVGEELIGRVVSPLGRPLDGKGAPVMSTEWPLFNRAPGLMERALLKDQLFTGVSIVDTLFPIVLGQRIAVLGDTKAGKTSFLLQAGVNQQDTDRIVVYVLIGKRRVEINQVLNTLNETGAMKNSIVVVANIFDSLAQSYIAPYVACAIAEFLWYNGRDVVIVYDDLTSHAKVYREISLLGHGNPGRDSYPGDMFYAHSALLERAGKLAKNGKTLTALPVVLTPGDDITAYLPTSIMSITDGQIVFDLATFRQNIRPAVNAGLSVSRVGGRAQSARQKMLSTGIFKLLASFRQASEFANFGADMSSDSRRILQMGHLLQEAFRQQMAERFTQLEQQLILETILASDGRYTINVGLLKEQARQLAPFVKAEADIDATVQKMLSQTSMGELQL